jgi:predicted CXXCH cytochrome family protein
MRNLPQRAAKTALFALALLALSACIDEEAAFQNRGLFADMPTVAGSFVGYITPEDKLTSCGACHLELQEEWEMTGHAEAWAGLQESGHAEAFCETCHTTNAYGNAVEGNAGHTVTREVRYQDVQCESCHGPGLEHVLDPRPGTIPLAPMAVGVDLTTGCGECHQGSHQPFTEEWSRSKHGSVNVYPASRAECVQCHTGEGALAAWGIDADYVEKASLSEPGSHMAVTCAVCHDPHGGTDHTQLRFPLDVTDPDQNLCMKCHNERPNPDPDNERGPHAPAGAALVGTAGWFPPDLVGNTGLVMAHGSPDDNPGLCASCHVYAFGVENGETGEFVFQATGHLFKSIPCLDGEGKPQAGLVCDDAERSFQSCATSGCHSDEASARQARADAEGRIGALVTELRALLNAVPSSEYDARDSRYTVAEGARFNAQLSERTGSAVHNPVLMEALLLESIEAMESEYGLQAAPGLQRVPFFTAN